MIVCHCEVVNDQQVRTVLDAGATTVAQVCRATGAGRQCGNCLFSIKRVVCQHGAVMPVDVVEVEGAAS